MEMGIAVSRYRFIGNGNRSPKADESRSPRFFVFRNGQEDGPFSRPELEEMHHAGKLSAAVPCRFRDEREWHDLAYTLKASVAEVEVEPAPSVTQIEMEMEPAPAPVSPEPAPEPVRKEESFRALMAQLVGEVQRQNQHMRGIKWCLVCLVALAAIALVVAVV